MYLWNYTAYQYIKTFMYVSSNYGRKLVTEYQDEWSQSLYLI